MRAGLAAVGAALVFAPSASADASVDFDASFDGGGTLWVSTSWDGSESPWVEFVVRYRGRVVRHTSWDGGYGGSYESVRMSLHCERTGRHEWIVRQEDLVEDRVLEERRGYFTVGRCLKRRDRKVGRARAAYADARAQRDDVYVSSARCRPTRISRGPAARWTCIVTWNDNIRECRDRDRLWFWSQRRFGKRGQGYSIRSRRLRCRYY